MALLINSDCTNCGACELECPNEAITLGEQICIIDPAKCTECVGHYNKSQCIAACPTDCIFPDPAYPESKDMLRAKYERLSASAA